MYGYVYLTTNLINNRKYIGRHKSSVFDPDYKGSGKLLWRAINKYGWDNFKVELLEECNSNEHLNEREQYWIDKFDAVESTEYYNIVEGGGTVQGLKHTEETKRRMSETRKGRKLNIKDIEAYRRKISECHADMHGENNPMYGKHHSEETRQLISAKRTERQTGTRWVNNGTHEIYAKGDKLDELLSQGYTYGRLRRSKSHKRTERLTGTKWVNNGTREIYAKGDELNELLSQGYTYGRLRKWINNGVEGRLAYGDELIALLNEGWVPGMLRRKPNSKQGSSSTIESITTKKYSSE